jgi:phosphoglycerate dehydrogenase-like enzyme
VLEALKRRDHLSYLSIDVYEEEGSLFFVDLSTTIIQDDTFARLTTLPNVVITGHQGFLTRDALVHIAETTLTNVSDFQSGQTNPEDLVRSPHSMVKAETPLAHHFPARRPVEKKTPLERAGLSVGGPGDLGEV